MKRATIAAIVQYNCGTDNSKEKKSYTRFILYVCFKAVDGTNGRCREWAVSLPFLVRRGLPYFPSALKRPSQDFSTATFSAFLHVTILSGIYLISILLLFRLTWMMKRRRTKCGGFVKLSCRYDLLLIVFRRFFFVLLTF